MLRTVGGHIYSHIHVHPHIFPYFHVWYLDGSGTKLGINDLFWYIFHSRKHCNWRQESRMAKGKRHSRWLGMKEGACCRKECWKWRQQAKFFSLNIQNTTSHRTWSVKSKPIVIIDTENQKGEVTATRVNSPILMFLHWWVLRWLG